MAVRPPPLTREDLRDELRRFAAGALTQDLTDIVSQVREDLRAELHRCFLEWSPHIASPEQPHSQSHAHAPRGRLAEHRAPEDPEGVPSGSLNSSPGRLADGELGSEAAAAGCKDPDKAIAECLQQHPRWRVAQVLDREVEDSPVDSQADTEASPRPTYRLKQEAIHASPHRSRLPSVFAVFADDGVHSTSSTSSIRGRRQFASSHGDSNGGGQNSSAFHDVRGQVTSHSSVSTYEQPEITDPTSFFRRHYHNFANRITISTQVGPRRSSRLSARISRMAGARTPALGTGPCARLVNSGYFDYGTGFLILLNAAAIGAQTDYMARHVSNKVPPVFRGIEVFFCCVFTLELLIRLVVHKFYFFYSPEYMWNIFDTVLVVLQVTEEAMALTAPSQAVGDAGVNTDRRSRQGSNTDLSVMRVLRILRLIRIIRLVRILRLIGELRTIVVSIAGSLRSLCWTVLLLVIMMYLVGVYMTQLILDYRMGSGLLTNTKGDEGLVPTDAPSALTRYFGSLGMAMISLYQAITGGLNWHMLVDPMMSQISPWLSVLIGLYIAFSLFALMNVVTGVFVESALATAKSDRDMFLLQFVRKLFQEADKDQSGAITWDEFKACLGSKEMQMYFEAFDLDIHEAKNLFHLLDINGSGEVDFEEFVNGCFRLRGSAKALDLATFMSGFSTWNEQWVKFARRVDWQLRTLLKAQSLSTKEAPPFKSRMTSVKAPCGGMTLPSPGDSGSDDENGSWACEVDMDDEVGTSPRSSGNHMTSKHDATGKTEEAGNGHVHIDDHGEFYVDKWPQELFTAHKKMEPQVQNSGDVPVEPEKID